LRSWNYVLCNFSKFRLHTLTKKVTTNDVLNIAVNKYYMPKLVIHFQTLNTKVCTCPKRICWQFYQFFCKFFVFFHYAWESFCENGKTCQIKYLLDIICYWKVIRMERLTLSTWKVFTDKIKNPCKNNIHFVYNPKKPQVPLI